MGVEGVAAVAVVADAVEECLGRTLVDLALVSPVPAPVWEVRTWEWPVDLKEAATTPVDPIVEADSTLVDLDSHSEDPMRILATLLALEFPIR